MKERLQQFFEDYGKYIAIAATAKDIVEIIVFIAELLF